MRVPVLEVIGGTTLNLTWCNTGSVPSAIQMALFDKNELLVSSVTPVNSGNGLYFAPLYVPNSWPWYSARTIAVINANTYVNRALVRTYKLEVD